MDTKRFANSPTGNLTKVGQGEISYWAFVPNPLPPDLTLSNETILLLSEADRALGELAGVGRQMANPHILIRPFLHREAVSSSAIEGTQTEITDLYAYKSGQKMLPGFEASSEERDIREVINYIVAMDYGLARLDTLPISKRFMRELHERLMQGVRGAKKAPGEFRISQNWIGPTGCTLNEANFVPPPPDQMNENLDALEDYLHLKNRYPPLVRLALIHYQFEVIHPFLDGNGRIGRLLIPLLLVHWGLLPSPLLYLSVYLERNMDQYVELLAAVSEKGAWQDWLNFFLRGVTEQARDAAVRAKQLADLQTQWHKLVTTRYTSAALLKLADSLFESPMITVPQARRILDVTYRGASLIVEKLVEVGILQRDHNYPIKTFVAYDVINIIISNTPRIG